MCPIFFSSSRRGPSPQAPCPYPLHHLPNIFPPNLPQTPQTPNQGFTMSGVLPTHSQLAASFIVAFVIKLKNSYQFCERSHSVTELTGGTVDISQKYSSFRRAIA